MGTFHHGKGELHGITVVVDTKDRRVFVGRCDQVAPEGVILLDADVHDGTGDTEQSAWLAKAARFGIWKTIDRVVVPSADVAAVRRLADLRG